ncbi:DUF4834 family protein [Sphingobacterium sp. UT-1RO-CII-1]|uniref:DUF4834 family protein n=1 Tax=Sphingobacterium sp. UT-1RO-CII-1 TaxID=2995225 RepID=UPI002279F5C5|nr:DUF4834 family protein [Sphingobacterium sp. UT-1RO-CII-1]MCY4778203.1 DUF4834 family protein [Sphingobacterium sp. UT-1RO-CII-1]
MGLLKFIAIFFIVFYAVKYLFRLLMPFALRKMTEKLMHKAQQSQGGNGSYQYTTGNPFDQFKQHRGQKEGELRVDYMPKEDAKTRKGPQTAGEFVEFEEVK